MFLLQSQIFTVYHSLPFVAVISQYKITIEVTLTFNQHKIAKARPKGLP